MYLFDQGIDSRRSIYLFFISEERNGPRLFYVFWPLKGLDIGEDKVFEEEKNIDEFNQLFKEVEWMKKSLDRGLSEYSF